MKTLLLLPFLFAASATAAELTEIAGLPKSEIHTIYHYSCQRTMLEGEGISQFDAACPASQRLGLIHARYSYYLYNGQGGGNLNEKGTDTPYESPICERQILKLRCGGTPQVSFGLSSKRQGIYQAGVTLTPSPQGESRSRVYGWAALPDRTGNCPQGLVKIRPWMAQPQSIIEGSIDGTNPASSFINENNSLSDTRVEAEQPSPMAVIRNANNRRCAPVHSINPVPGSCENATFLPDSVVQRVEYTALSPVVCAIPKKDL